MKNLLSNRFPAALISLLLILPLLASSCNKAGNTDVSTYDNDSKIQANISTNANPGSEITVYITETGNKYHRAYCQYLRESKIEITLDLAIAFGYSRCSVCNPPRMNEGSTSKPADQEINWSDLWSHGENSFVESYTEAPKPTTSQFYSGEGTFGFGSTQESVEKIMGPPTSIRDYSFFTVWSYGLSTVTFENGIVTEWNNYSHNLKVSIGNRKAEANPFSIGSTQQEVIDAMGTPEKVSDYTFFVVWNYDLSTVTFKNGIVSEWNNYSNNLKIS